MKQNRARVRGRQEVGGHELRELVNKRLFKGKTEKG